MSGDLVQILDGNTFVVSDRRGDIEASLTDPTGLFSFDTRFLSRWVLTVNNERLTALSVDDLLPLEDYACRRKEFFDSHRRYVDRYRRVRIGPRLTLIFDGCSEDQRNRFDQPLRFRERLGSRLDNPRTVIPMLGRDADLRDDSRTNDPILIQDPRDGIYKRGLALRRENNGFRTDFLFSFQTLGGAAPASNAAQATNAVANATAPCAKLKMPDA